MRRFPATMRHRPTHPPLPAYCPLPTAYCPLPLLHPRLRKILGRGEFSAEEPGVLNRLPFALHLLDADGLRGKVDPLGPAAGLAEDGDVGNAIEHDSLLAGLAARRPFERDLPGPLEPVELVGIAQRL